MNKKFFSAILLIGLLLSCIPAAFACESAETLVINKTAKETGDLTANVTLNMTGTEDTKQIPADVVFAIDSSGSMGWNDPDEYRKDGVNNFVDQMDSSKDKVGVVNWDGSIQSSLALTSIFDDAKDKVDEGYDGGVTNMNLAIEKSIEFLDASALPVDQRFIILLTDGLWNTGSDPMTNGVLDAVAKGYAIYTIGLGSEVDATLLQSIATQTGGQYYFASDATVLNSIYDQIFQDITTVATDLIVTDVITSDFTYVDGSATVVPESVTINPDETTTLIWKIPKLGANDVWEVTYSIISKIYGEDIPTNTEAKVTYVTPEGNPAEQFFPIPTVSWIKPEPEPVEPVIPEPIVEVQSKTIPMEETGAAILPLLVGMIMMVIGGIGLRRQ